MEFTTLFRTDDIAVYAYTVNLGRDDRIAVFFKRYDRNGRCIAESSMFQPRTMTVEDLQILAIQRLGFNEDVRKWEGDAQWAETGRSANRHAEAVYTKLVNGKTGFFFINDYSESLSKIVAKDIGLSVRREPFRLFIRKISEAWLHILPDRISGHSRLVTIHTGSFRDVRAAVNPVSISPFLPEKLPWIPSCSLLTPSDCKYWDFRHGRISWNDFADMYGEQLSHISRKTAIKELVEIADATEFTLICGEGNGRPSHRHIAKAWLEGDEIAEWEDR